MGRELMLFSQRVTPARLIASGFVFEHRGIDQALAYTLRQGADPD
jgi:NAD dependent epimerase/dehydratase family enzyme